MIQDRCLFSNPQKVGFSHSVSDLALNISPSKCFDMPGGIGLLAVPARVTRPQVFNEDWISPSSFFQKTMASMPGLRLKLSLHSKRWLLVSCFSGGEDSVSRSFGSGAPRTSAAARTDCRV